MQSFLKTLLCLALALISARVQAEVIIAVQVEGGVERVKSFLSWDDLKSGTAAITAVAKNQEGALVAICSAGGKVTALRNVMGLNQLYEFDSFSDYIKGNYAFRTTAGRRHLAAVRGLATDGTRYWTQSYVVDSAHFITYSNRENLISGVASEDYDLTWSLDWAGDVSYSQGGFRLIYLSQLITYTDLDNYKRNQQASIIALPPPLGSWVGLTVEPGNIDPLADATAHIPLQESGLTQLVPVAGYLNGVFPTNVPGVGRWQVVNAFTNLSFVEPMQVLTDRSRPGSLLVAGLNGQVWRIPNDPAAPAESKQLVLDISGRVERLDNDHGLYRIELHPEFGDSQSRNGGFLYAIYMRPRPDLPGYQSGFTKYWRLSRFTMDLGTGLVDPGSEIILIDQYCPGIWHNGGGMFFGKDGLLYVTVGDNEREHETTQVIDGGLRSGVLRIDVDMNPLRSHPIRRQPTSAEVPVGWPNSYSGNYFIPNDNPWQSSEGRVLEEFYAIGLRNPYTMSQDALTGQIWIGDVGSDISEEINLVDQPGVNFQWPYREGFTQRGDDLPAEILGTERPPEMIYGHSDGGAIILGFVYRAATYGAELGGQLLFSDNTSGTIWAYDSVSRQSKVELANAGSGGGLNLGVVNLCPGPNGEVFIPFQAGRGVPDGQIKKLIPAVESAQPPGRLSETHAFVDLAKLTPHPAFIPYEPAAALWSDGAEKYRWLAVPNDGIRGSNWPNISVASDNWEFPAGSVTMKHFEISIDETKPSLRKRLETRFIVCLPDGGKYGVTYRWLDDGSDAVLVAGRTTIDYSIAKKSGAVVHRQWTVPSRADCLYCHNAASGQALGLKGYQLNHDLTYPASGRTGNQMATLGYLGLISPARNSLELSNLLKAHALGDHTAPLEHRVRSYLDANCAHCHQPGGGGPGFDARLNRALADQTLVNEVIKGHFAFVPQGRLVNPGEVATSALHFRASSGIEGLAMPPIGRNVVDDLAVEEMARWIRTLHPEEFVNASAPVARYFRLRALSEVNGQPWAAIAELRIIGANGAAYPQSSLVVSAVSSENYGYAAGRAIDGDEKTLWSSQWSPLLETHPHTLTLDLGAPKPIGGFEYQPRNDGADNGRIAQWEAEISLDGMDWKPFLSGTFPNTGLPQRRAFGSSTLWPVRPQLGVPGRVVTGDFEIVITTDTEVTDFVFADLADAVTNGTATALRGSGHYYVATIHPTGGPVTIHLKENLMGNGFSAASNTVTVGYLEEAPDLSAELLTVPKSGGLARVVLKLNQPLTKPTVVRVYARSGTALEGQDFAPYDENITLPSGVGSVDVAVPLIKSAQFVAGRSFFLELEPGAGFTIAEDELTIPIGGSDSGLYRDLDADSLPDIWEIAHFGDLSEDADGDPDADLVGNLLEYLLGTSPELAGPYMGITSLEFAPGGVKVTWASVAGMNYDVYISADLSVWTRSGGAGISASGPYTSATLELPAGQYDQRFFVKVVAQE